MFAQNDILESRFDKPGIAANNQLTVRQRHMRCSTNSTAPKRLIRCAFEFCHGRCWS